MKPNLVISCPATSRSGYGDHARDLIRSLITMNKFNIGIVDQRWGDCPRTALTSKDFDITNLMLKEPMKQQPDVWIQLTVPNEFQPVGKFNIGITAGIETTQVAAPWLEGMNRMNLTIVPSEHSKTSFMTSSYDKVNQQTKKVEESLKCTVPIEVLFEGLDENVYKKIKEPKASTLSKSIDSIKEDFCFLYVGHWLQGAFGEDRKDIGMTIKIFMETFKKQSKRNQPALILKTSSAGFSVIDREQCLKKIVQIKDMIGDAKFLPNIYLLHGDLTDDEMNSLYNHRKIKAMISFTKGEGFGRPLLEFGATGKPIIAPMWSGQIDFLSENGFMLHGQLKDVHPSAYAKDMIIEKAKWFAVDYGYASSMIKDIQKNYKQSLLKSRKQPQYIKENFTLDKMTEKFEVILKKYMPTFENSNPNPKLEELQTYA